MNKKLIITTFSFFIAVLLHAQVYKTINVPTAGTLSNLLTYEEKSTVTDLIVTGSIDARDIVCMRDEIKKLTVLDMSATSIIAYSGSGGTQECCSYNLYTYPANELPYHTIYNSGTSFSGGYNTTLKAISLPSTLTSIGERAFSCDGLTSISIPTSVTSIGMYAFDCSGLSSITIPPSVTSIGVYALNRTAWYNNQPNGLIYAGKIAYCYKGTMPANTTITLNSDTKAIAPSAFQSCSGLNVITIPSSLTTIGEGAFRACTGLNSISIPSSVTSIGSGAFQSCSGLSAITIPSFVTSIGSSTFKDCTNLTSISIPSSVTSIGSDAFTNTPWLNNQTGGILYIGTVAYKYIGKMPANTAIVLNAGTKVIAERAFENCSGMTLISIPSSVNSIGYAAFSNCSSLTSLTIPSSVTSIGGIAFYGCTGLTSIKIPNSVASIDSAAFIGCVNITDFEGATTLFGYNPAFIYGLNDTYNCPTTLKNVKFTKGALTQNIVDWLKLSNRTLEKVDMKEVSSVTLPMESFKDCYAIDSLILPSKLAQISSGSFLGCKSIKTITIPKTVTDIEMSAFENCRSLKKVLFEPNSQLTNIGNWAFYACHGLDSLSIPIGVNTVGDGAFWGCDYLKNISLPSSIQKIQDNGFEGCVSLNSMTIKSVSPPSIDTNTFNKVNKNIPLFVPDESVNLYKTAFGWKEFYNIKGLSTSTKNPIESDFSIIMDNKTILLSNVNGKSISVYDISGMKIFEKSISQYSEEIKLNSKGVYLISIDNFRKKVIAY